jgi:rod shape-determining protein MreD
LATAGVEPPAAAGILGSRPSAGTSGQTQTQGNSEITYTSVLLAIVVGIVHAGLAPVIEIADVRPNLILVSVVLVTALLGFGPGILWAFAGGLTANLLVQDPLGSLPLALLLVSAMVAGGSRVLGRLTWVYPVLAAFAGSVLADLIKLGVYRLVDDPLVVGLPLAQIIPAAFLNAAILALLLYPVRSLTLRMLPEERPAW